MLGSLLCLGVALALAAGAAAPSGHAHGLKYSSLAPIQKRLVSGALAQALGGPPPAAPGLKTAAAAASGCVSPTSGGDEPDEADNECAPDAYAPPSSGGGGGGDQNYTPSKNNGCAISRGDNVKVNQNCANVADPALAGRSQAQNETAVAIDPNDPNHIVAGQNDYRRGDGNCYGEYSLDGGKSWQDTTIPMGFTAGSPTWGTPRQYWQAGGDTSVAWDTKGNVYFSCQMFNRGAGVTSNPDQSSAFYVFRSTGNDGASWNFPGRPTTEFNDTAGTGAVLEDKAYLTVDDHAGSPFQDRIYVTWTEFAADGSSYIYEVHSNDYGEHFSPRVLVSKDSPLCPFTWGQGTPNGRCNENQFSDPFTGPDGNLYVTWVNTNTATAQPGSTGDNHFQILLAKSTDGGASFSAPVKVGNYYDLPDCLTYQGSDPFRSCVPEKGPSKNSVFRATNYPSGAVSPKTGQVVVTYGSYVNQDSNETNGCTPAGISTATTLPLYTGVKTPGACANDILVSVSNDGGGTFTGTTADPRTMQTVNGDPNQALSDQFWQWEAFDNKGNLAVDYYDRQYGKPTSGVPSDEWTGSSDITLSGSKDLSKWGTRRVTSSSMPPPTQFGGQFLGDYIGIDAAKDAISIWADTRDPEQFLCPGTGTPTAPPAVCTATFNSATGPVTANDENIYAATDPVPTK
jgi:hypothetical protein